MIPHWKVYKRIWILSARGLERYISSLFDLIIMLSGISLDCKSWGCTCYIQIKNERVFYELIVELNWYISANNVTHFLGPGSRRTQYFSICRYKEVEKRGIFKPISSSIPGHSYKFCSSHGTSERPDTYQYLSRFSELVGCCSVSRTTLVLCIVLITAYILQCCFLQRAQDLANVTSYREWVLLGYLVCPDELLRVTSIDIALVQTYFYFVLGWDLYKEAYNYLSTMAEYKSEIICLSLLFSRNQLFLD